MGITVKDGKLFAVTASSEGLWERQNRIGPDAAWTRVTGAADPTDIATGLDNELYLLTGDGRHWVHHPDGDPWILIPDNPWVTPGAWVRFTDYGGNNATVRFGHDASDETILATRFQFPTPGADIAIVKLRSVPTGVTPKSTLTRVPAAADGDATGFFAMQSFDIVGWGGYESGSRPPTRRTGTATGGGVYPMQFIDHKTESMITIEAGSGGAAGRPGDSGGPLIWSNPVGQRCVAGAMNNAGFARPNIGRWLEKNARGARCGG